jgi:hypothetical protein
VNAGPRGRRRRARRDEVTAGPNDPRSPRPPGGRQTPDREARLADVVSGVVGAALRDAAARRLFLVYDGSPEAGLCSAWLTAGLPDGVLRPVAAADLHGVESPLQHVQGAEAIRALARTLARAEGGLVAGPANRTTLLLAPDAAPDAILPVGDLWASRIDALAGNWSGPPEVTELADRLGGVEELDRALAAWLAGRPLGVGADLERPLIEALRRGRVGRRWPRLVPKLENRTAWIDLGR